MPGAPLVPMLIDCDPGVDDALAILCAAARVDLIGITTVNGNVGIDDTTRNALAITQIGDLDVGVHRGADRPLASEVADARHVHGPTGLGTAELPALDRSTVSDDAVGFIVDASRSVEGLQLVAVGPLTNIALALQRDPGLLDRLGGFTIMGGAAAGGNVTPAAEFNIWADPEAAAVVFGSGAPITMVGLDVTEQVLLGPAERDALQANDTSAAAFAAELLDHAMARAGALHGTAHAPMHDACAVIAVTHPELFGGRTHPVTIELTGTHTRGMTVVDDRSGVNGPRTGETTVLRSVDAAAVRRLIVESVAAVGAR